jgi:hypothetical protein
MQGTLKYTIVTVSYWLQLLDQENPDRQNLEKNTN